MPRQPAFVDRPLDTGAWHLCDVPTYPGMSVIGVHRMRAVDGNGAFDPKATLNSQPARGWSQLSRVLGEAGR